MTGEPEAATPGAPEHAAPASRRTVYRAPREWHRLHPISPLLGGWAVLGVVGSVMLYNYAPSWSGPDEYAVEIAHALTSSIGWFALGAFVILGVTIGFGYLQWRVNQYRLGDEAVHQRKGIVFRQQRQARLDRLQAVDVVQPLLARIFGFAVLRIEVAGGENSGIALEYLRLGDAEAMRNELLALAAGVKRAKAAGKEATVDAIAAQSETGHAADAGVAYAGEASLRDIAGMPQGEAETPAAPEREVYAVPLSRLALSIVLSGPFIFIVTVPALVGIAVLALPIDLGDILAVTVGASLFTVLPAAFALLGYFWSRFNSGFGFKAALSPDGIRLRHGALETRRQTVPPGRVQAVRFHQTLLWRHKDWWRVTINVAGYQDDQENVSTLLPVGSRQDALTALWLVLPDLGDPDPAGTVSTALSGSGDEHGFIPSPRRARLFDPIQWRQRGVRATDRALLIRRGRLSREMFVVPHERTQSLQLQQGALQRRRGLATFVVHSTNGPVKPVAEHLDVDDALALLDSQAQRAAEGRRRQTPEQWMSAVGIRE
ncbi:PH domain-containing protein [Demequina muriae]|uniref:PH domain-containing protein n=1 Tax=Demequina muriae TaxID=3051664 RepID=A0ABT8GFX4_9MICO|nr:PH domain-containing protein [Demequina sp. EGI L300058]MDN4480154.1 PH domain-containing protein [Demequina sp. EGI L300058]